MVQLEDTDFVEFITFSSKDTDTPDIFNDDNRYSLSFKKSKPFLSHMSFTIHSNNFDVIHIIEHISDELNIDDDDDDISDEFNIHDIDDR